MIAEQEQRAELFNKQWVIAKRPFATPMDVVEYLGRYTHKIAISNHRIKQITENQISFTAKNYKAGGKKELIALDPKEFVRRFSMHILPKGFVRIRHYGILSSKYKKTLIPKLQKDLADNEITIELKEPKKLYN